MNDLFWILRQQDYQACLEKTELIFWADWNSDPTIPFVCFLPKIFESATSKEKKWSIGSGEKWFAPICAQMVQTFFQLRFCAWRRFFVSDHGSWDDFDFAIVLLLSLTSNDYFVKSPDFAKKWNKITSKNCSLSKVENERRITVGSYVGLFKSGIHGQSGRVIEEYYSFLTS